ncbi:MAG TPA: glycosyltransferase family 4 protein, partial [Acidimicrobiales bacterium]|nr:glycosyltransferase family 4 protein [Acidimicrobiales bacterium]
RYYCAPFRAADAVRAISPDVVHAHQDDWPLALDPRWKVPIVRTYHGRKMAEARTSRRLRRVNHYALAGLESVTRRQYPVAVGVGPDSVGAFGCDHLIPPVFLVGEPSPPATKAPEPLAVFVGAFDTRKRGRVALRAAIHARQVLPDMRFAVVGPAGDRSRYPRWVDFLATPDDDQVQALIGEAWVLLAPSVYEGFGIPAWEAMVARTAVIATTNPGIDFLSAGGACCTIVEPLQMGPALVRLVQSEPDRTDQVRRGFARACEVAVLGRPERYVSLFHSVAI